MKNDPEYEDFPDNEKKRKDSQLTPNKVCAFNSLSHELLYLTENLHAPFYI